jgi:elongation factor P
MLLWWQQACGREEKGSFMRANNLKVGNLIKHNNNLYRIRVFNHVTPGKGRAIVQTKLQSVLDGSSLEVRFRADEDVETAVLDPHQATFLYREDENFVFMDTESYEQHALHPDFLGEAVKYLQEDMEVTLQYYEGNPIDIELPMSVVLAIAETEPPMKGATAAGGSKTAVLDNGMTVKVPMHLDIGDKLRVDTRSDSFIERVY